MSVNSKVSNIVWRLIDRYHIVWLLLLIFLLATFCRAQSSQAPANMPPPAILPGASASNLVSPDFTRMLIIDTMNPALHSAAGIRSLVQTARLSGFDTIVVQVRSNGDAYYKSSLVPPGKDVDPSTNPDPLDTVIREAKSADRPMKVYALFTVLRVWKNSLGTPPQGHVGAQNAKWITMTVDNKNLAGNDELWLDCGIPAVQDHLASVVSELLKNYPLDGIVFDRLRAPGNAMEFGYAPEAVAKYNETSGGIGAPNPTDPKWIEWRRDQLTVLLSKLYDTAKQTRHECRVGVMAGTGGAAPVTPDAWRIQSEPYVRQLQDWVLWCERGLVDDCILSNLKPINALADYIGWTRFAVANRGRSRMVIAVASWLNRPQQVAAMMLAPIFEQNAGGVALYCSDALQDNGMNVLCRQIFNPTFVSSIAAEVTQNLSMLSSTGNPSFLDNIISIANFGDANKYFSINMSPSSTAQQLLGEALQDNPPTANDDVLDLSMNVPPPTQLPLPDVKTQLPGSSQPSDLDVSSLPKLPEINELGQIEMPTLPDSDPVASMLDINGSFAADVLPSDVPIGTRVSVPGVNSSMTNFYGIPMKDDEDVYTTPQFEAPKIKKPEDLGAYTETGVPAPDVLPMGRSRAIDASAGFKSYIDKPLQNISSRVPDPNIVRSAETIRLKSGRQFSGKVINRGRDVWTIKLLNGSEISVRTSQISTSDHSKTGSKTITPPPNVKN